MTCLDCIVKLPEKQESLTEYKSSEYFPVFYNVATSFKRSLTVSPFNMWLNYWQQKTEHLKMKLSHVKDTSLQFKWSKFELHIS